MSIAEEFNKPNLVDRVKNVLLKPAQTWTVISVEPATVKGLYTDYALILAAIPPVAALIGGQVFGHSIFGITYRAPLVGSIIGAIFSYVLSLASIYILALIIDALAPSFDGRKSHIQAMKVAVYSYTAVWVAGIFSIIPALTLLGALGGLYSLYLLYLGLPAVMSAPAAKALGYTAVCVIVAVVLSIIVGAIVGVLGLGAISASGGGYIKSSDNNGGTAHNGQSTTVNIGGAAIDLDKLKAASQAIEAATNQANNTTKQAADTTSDRSTASADTPPVVAVSSDILKGYLPDSIAGYTRGDVTASSGGVAGFSGSNVQAEYSKSGAHMTLSVTDIGAAGGFAALAGAFGVESSKETATGYEKIGKVDGRMTAEEWDRQSKNGKYGVLIANRFMVQAEGNGGDVDDLKSAVNAVGPDKLEGLVKK